MNDGAERWRERQCYALPIMCWILLLACLGNVLLGIVAVSACMVFVSAASPRGATEARREWTYKLAMACAAAFVYVMIVLAVGSDHRK